MQTMPENLAPGQLGAVPISTRLFSKENSHKALVYLVSRLLSSCLHADACMNRPRCIIKVNMHDVGRKLAPSKSSYN